MEQMARVKLREADTKEKFIEIVKMAAKSKSLSPDLLRLSYCH